MKDPFLPCYHFNPGRPAVATAGTEIHPFREGLVNNLLNPKAAAFYTAKLSQFLPANVPALPATLFLAAIACMVSLLGLGAYAYVSSRAEGALHSRRFTGWTDGLAGVVLLGLGAYGALRSTSG